MNKKNSNDNENENENEDATEDGLVKNLDVTMPLKDKLTKQQQQAMINKMKEDKDNNILNERKHDPLLLNKKLKDFCNLFVFLSTDEQTPVEHRPRLHALSRIFETKNTVPIPDRQALKNALKKDCSIGVTRIPITAQKIQSLKKQKKKP